MSVRLPRSSSVALALLLAAAALAASASAQNLPTQAPASVRVTITDTGAPVPLNGTLILPVTVEYCYWTPGAATTERAVIRLAVTREPEWANATVVPPRVEVPLDGDRSCQPEIEVALLVTPRDAAGPGLEGDVWVEARASAGPVYANADDTDGVTLATPPGGIREASRGNASDAHVASALEEAAAPEASPVEGDAFTVAVLGLLGGVAGLAVARARVGP